MSCCTSFAAIVPIYQSNTVDRVQQNFKLRSGLCNTHGIDDEDVPRCGYACRYFLNVLLVLLSKYTSSHRNWDFSGVISGFKNMSTAASPPS